MKTCPDCNGEGVIEKGTDDEQRCPNCGGTGFVPDDDDDNEEVIRTGTGGDAMRDDGDYAASREQAMAEFKGAVVAYVLQFVRRIWRQGGAVVNEQTARKI